MTKEDKYVTWYFIIVIVITLGLGALYGDGPCYIEYESKTNRMICDE